MDHPCQRHVRRGQITQDAHNASDVHRAAQRDDAYRERLTAILNALKEALGVENIPILLGGLGDFLVANTEFDYLKNYTHINRTLADMADADPYMAFVSAEGLAGNPDNLHFSAASLREFGLRYYAEYEKIATVAKASTTEADAPRSKMELL